MADQDRIELAVIIPVYNRPDEVDELLESLCNQTDKDFEVIVVEDGSTQKCDKQVEKYTSLLKISYFYKPNTGPGLTRNYGTEKSRGNYSIFLDSDCILPPHYIQVVRDKLKKDWVDAFGGPDKAHPDFTTIQKAIDYSMTSFLTTGGIRGGSEKLDTFYPRSFNMGFSKSVFEKTKGFSSMRFGEDIDMSIRILNCGFKTALIKEAFVYHKRRSNLKQFFKQVFNSGIARINLYKRHPASLKIVHFFPSLFLLGTLLFLLLALFISTWFLLPLVLYTLFLFFDASVKNKSMYIGLVSIGACYVQLTGYGAGFLVAFWKRVLFSGNEFSAFLERFYN